MNAALFGGGGHGTGVFHVNRQGFLHHHLNASRGARFHDPPVIERAGERGHGLHIGPGQQLFQGGEEQISVEFVKPGVLRHKLLIRFDDANHLHLRMSEREGEESPHMGVNEADDGKAHRRLVGF